MMRRPVQRIGVREFRLSGTDPALLLRQAGLVLYQAKIEGRGTCCFFEAVPMLVA